jgi:hypothetical protein
VDCFLRARRRRRWGAVSGKISEFHKAAVLATLYIWGRQWVAVSTDIYQELLRQHVVPWVQRDGA